MTSANTNQKLPNTDIQVTYPWASVEQTMCGHEHIWNNTPNNELIRVAHQIGTFKEWGADGAERKLVANTSYKVHAQGKSDSTEGPRDNMYASSLRRIIFGGDHTEGDKDSTSAFKGNLLHFTGLEKHEYQGSGDIYKGGQDDHVMHVGSDSNTTSHHAYNAGDQTQWTGGNFYSQVAGEFGLYLPGGNMDMQLDKGQYRLAAQGNVQVISNSTINTNSSSDTNMTSNAKFVVSSSGQMNLTSNSSISITGQNDITITSQSTITLKVGSASIKITSSGITIDAGGGNVDIKGHPTKINGGGMSSPPVTYP